jgi:hypothetical protein
VLGVARLNIEFRLAKYFPGDRPAGAWRRALLPRSQPRGFAVLGQRLHHHTITREGRMRDTHLLLESNGFVV